MTVFYSPEYSTPCDLDTTAKSRCVADLIQAHLSNVVNLTSPAPATQSELEQIHKKEYLENIFQGKTKTLEIGTWSLENLQSILASTGGMRDAVKAALKTGASGSLSSGLHHAHSDFGLGFCNFNGLALATIEALKYVPKVGILDLDAHFGGGTAEILGNNSRVSIVDISVNSFDRWEALDHSRHFVHLVQDSEMYIPDIIKNLENLKDVNFLIYNAGMDAHEYAGGLKGITDKVVKKRETIVADWCRQRRIPAIFALAGGYTSGGLTLEELSLLHLETVRAFADFADTQQSATTIIQFIKDLQT